MDDRSIEELLAEIANGIHSIKTALVGDDDYPDRYVFVPPTGDVHERAISWKLPDGSDKTSYLIAWRISEYDSSVCPITWHGPVTGQWRMDP